MCQLSHRMLPQEWGKLMGMLESDGASPKKRCKGDFNILEVKKWWRIGIVVIPLYHQHNLKQQPLVQLWFPVG